MSPEPACDAGVKTEFPVFEPEPPILFVELDVSLALSACPLDVKAPERMITFLVVAAFNVLLNLVVSLIKTVDDFWETNGVRSSTEETYCVSFADISNPS